MSDAVVNEIIENDEDEDCNVDMEVIASAIEEMERMVEMLDGILTQLHTLRTRMGGVCILCDGESRPLSELLPLWKEEYEQGMIHRITWGQFLIEKLNESM
jgi:hypothetical protein